MRSRSSRLPLLILAMLGLLGALWAGWIRIGWNWPAPVFLPGVHGPLMVCGFLGTLIGLEKAVALQRPWMFAAPLLSGLGGLILILGAPQPLAAGLTWLGSLVLLMIFYVIVRQHRALYTITMSLGALAWVIGNTLWLGGSPIYLAVWWWAVFLVLTIAGERLELGRIQRLPQAAGRLFSLCLAVVLAGAALSVIHYLWGSRLVGAGFVLLSLWLLRYDIARRTVRQTGLPRFVALALLPGFVWLGIGGCLAVYYAGLAAGPYYDAVLHAIFIGFVISMIFGHAPIIFPAVLGLEIRYTPWLYLPLVLLHVSLILRIFGDLALQPALRSWGGLLNGIAILLYFLVFLVNLIRNGTRLAKAAPTT